MLIFDCTRLVTQPHKNNVLYKLNDVNHWIVAQLVFRKALDFNLKIVSGRIHR